MQQPDVSVVIPTYNRSALLRTTLDSVFNQTASDLSYEVIVVDNNSTDDTAAVVRALQAHVGPSLQYVKELQQGSSHARNAGIRQARAPIIAFTDDDVRVAPDWLRRIVDVFESDPQSVFLGGPVLPLWEGTQPAWLTRDNWSPLAILDYGPTSFEIGGNDQRGLITANFAIRRDALDRVGMFGTALQLVGDTIGAMEDHELQERLRQSGAKGRYVPAVVTHTAIPPERLTRSYHRRWHRGHGRRYSILRDRGMEQSRMTLLGVPSHLYRMLVSGAAGWLTATMRRAPGHALTQEARFWFAVGFIAERVRKR